MSEFNFQGNAKQLFEIFIKAPPMPLRPMIKKALTGALEKRVGAGGEVSEANVIAAVKDSTPGPFLKGALKAAVGVYKCPTKCDGCTDCPLAP